MIVWNVRLHPLLVTIYLFDILECSTAPYTGDNLPVWYSGMFDCTLYWWRFTSLIVWNVRLHPLLVTIYLFDSLECSTAPSTGDDLPVWYSGMFDCTLYWWRFTCLICSTAPSTGDDLPVWYVRLHPLLVTIYLFDMFDCTLYWWRFTCLICSTAPSTSDNLPVWYVRLHPLLVTIYLFDMFDCTLYWWRFTCLIFWNVQLHPVLVTIYLFDILERSTAPSNGDDLPVWYSGMFNCTLYWWQFTCLIFWNVRLHPLMVTIYLFDMFDCTLYRWWFTCLIFWNVWLHPLLVTIYLFDMFDWWRFIYLFDILERSTQYGDLVSDTWIGETLFHEVISLPVWYCGTFDSVWRSCLWYYWWRFIYLFDILERSTQYGDLVSDTWIGETLFHEVISLPVWYSGTFDSVWRSCLWYLDWWNTLPWSNQFTCLIFWNVRLSMEILSLILGLVKHSSMK